MKNEMEGMSMHVAYHQPQEKTVMVMTVDNARRYSTMFTQSNFESRGTGTGELFGASLPYEGHGTDSGDVRFFAIAKIMWL